MSPNCISEQESNGLGSVSGDQLFSPHFLCGKWGPGRGGDLPTSLPKLAASLGMEAI
jgi:hypothetical protein